MIWIFRETGEVRNPKQGEWFNFGGNPYKSSINRDTKWSILSREIRENDPMEPIREVYNAWKSRDYHWSTELSKLVQPSITDAFVCEVWQAIKKALVGK